MLGRVEWIDPPELSAGPTAADLLAFVSGERTREFGVSSADLWKRRPAYRELTSAELQQLRCALYAPEPPAVARPWLEAMMRFCEVNLWRIERCMRDIWGKDAAPALTVLTAACLLECAVSTADARFLNTVIKLKQTKFFPSAGAGSGSGAAILALAQAVDRTTTLRLEACRA